MNYLPRVRFPVRTVNALLGRLQSAGIARADLDPERLIDQACSDTGLEDFGGGPFRPALEVLVNALESEARLTPLGRFVTRNVLLGGLTIQLRLQDAIRTHPEITARPLQAPIIIIGMPRTGTTILHELLALDPANRIPLTWEVAEPFPPPQAATYDIDPRIGRSRRNLRVSHYLMPGIENMHRMGATLPQECVAVTAHAFASMMFTTIYRIPSYSRWLFNEADHTAVYGFHRRMHQLLQWHCMRERWVLKSPGHLWSLEALLAAYPDARLVQTHRDPLKIVSSLASMIPTLRRAASDAIDVREVAREWTDICIDGLDASVRSRRSGAVRAGQIVDIRFGDFMADQAGAVQRIYDAFGLEFTDDFRQCIHRYIARNPHDKHGGHRHRFGDTGLDLDSEREKVRAYQSYFAVPSEI